MPWFMLTVTRWAVAVGLWDIFRWSPFFVPSPLIKELLTEFVRVIVPQNVLDDAPTKKTSQRQKKSTKRVAKDTYAELSAPTTQLNEGMTHEVSRGVFRQIELTRGVC